MKGRNVVARSSAIVRQGDVESIATTRISRKWWHSTPTPDFSQWGHLAKPNNVAGSLLFPKYYGKGFATTTKERLWDSIGFQDSRFYYPIASPAHSLGARARVLIDIVCCGSECECVVRDEMNHFALKKNHCIYASLGWLSYTTTNRITRHWKVSWFEFPPFGARNSSMRLVWGTIDSLLCTQSRILKLYKDRTEEIVSFVNDALLDVTFRLPDHWPQNSPQNSPRNCCSLGYGQRLEQR